MQHNPLRIVAVYHDNMVYARQDSKNLTLEYRDIESLDYSFIQYDGIIQAFKHDGSLIEFDTHSLPAHGLGDAFNLWLHKNGKSGFGSTE